ncbi:MAG TPA: hypothetical protein DCQ47_04615, partial [Gammaproteobacteria bacterium]|nr:hypothetical protein [Gammaproteobacteria bacterium]
KFVQLIKRFVWFLGNMPLFLRRYLAKIVTVYLLVIPNQFAKITKLNVELAYPELSEKQRLRLVRA